jgi:hypothetical protein
MQLEHQRSGARRQWVPMRQAAADKGAARSEAGLGAEERNAMNATERLYR